MPITDILNQDWGPFTHDEVEDALKAILLKLQQDIENSGVPAGGITADMLATALRNAINNAVPNSRTVNGKQLSGNVTLTAEDVNALPASTPIPAPITVDDAMSDVSTDAVQNKVVKAYVDGLVNGLVNGAPSTLNTLKKLADALNLKANAADVSGMIAEAVEGLGGGSVGSITVNGQPKTPDTHGNINLGDIATEEYVDDKLTDVVVNEISGATDIVVIDDADLAFIDEDGHVAMRVRGGHVESKNFDSRQVAANTADIQQLKAQRPGTSGIDPGVSVADDSDAAFDITDQSGKVALRVTNSGHIKTKKFDSGNISISPSLVDMAILRATKLTPHCVCHGRGNFTDVPMNTMPYLKKGIQAGYKFFEIDAYDCSDGVPICIHTTDNISGKFGFYHKVLNESTQEYEDEYVEITTTQIRQQPSTHWINNYYLLDSNNNQVSISTLNEVIWYICYRHRFPLHLDGAGARMSAASRLAASQYAESLGVGGLAFHEIADGPYTNWDIPCNVITLGDTVELIQTKAATYKKPDNNLIFYKMYYGANENTAATAKELADAAHAVGCYFMVWTIASEAVTRAFFENGVDFVITEGGINITL